MIHNNNQTIKSVIYNFINYFNLKNTVFCMVSDLSEQVVVTHILLINISKIVFDIINIKYINGIRNHLLLYEGIVKCFDNLKIWICILTN